MDPTVVLVIALTLFTVSWAVTLMSVRCGPLGLVIHIYFCLFLLLPGISHAARNRFPFYGMAYSVEEIQAAANLIIAFAFVFLAMYHFLTFAGPRRTFVRALPDVNEERVAVALVVLNIVQIVSIMVVGPAELLRNRDEFDSSVFGDATHFVVLFTSIARGSSFAACLILLHLFLIGRKADRYAFVLPTVGLAAVINFPLSLARYILFAYIFAFLFISIRKMQHLKYFISISFILGITTIFPFISSLGRPDSDAGGNFFLASYLESGDFDGLQSIINCVNYVARFGISSGIQLMGDLLVWIPRALWSGKPEVTGILVAQAAGYDMTNISAPIIAELYFDFGFYGSLVGAAGLAALVWKLDGWSFDKGRTRVSHLYLASWIFGVSIIIMRGSLMAVLGPIFIYAACIYLVAVYIEAPASSGQRRVN